MIRLNQRHLHPARPRHLRLHVHGQGHDPLGVHAEHVDDEVRGALGAVDGPALPVVGEVGVVV